MEIFFKIIVVLLVLILYGLAMYDSYTSRHLKQDFIIKNKCVENFGDVNKSFTYYECDKNIVILN